MTRMDNILFFHNPKAITQKYGFLEALSSWTTAFLYTSTDSTNDF